MNLTIDQRVSVAREILGGWSQPEYEALPTDCKVNLQEAIDFLEHYEQARQRDGAKK